MLHNRVELESGNRYRLTSTERSGSGDPWYDKAQRGREQVSFLARFRFHTLGPTRRNVDAGRLDAHLNRWRLLQPATTRR